MKTGKTVGHKEFPRRQSEPKKESKEEKAGKIDYQKMAQEMRWKPPEKFFNRCTMYVLANDNEVYAWDVPNAFSISHRFKLRRVPRSPMGPGCQVVAFDLKGRKRLWQTRLKGLNYSPDR